MAETGKIVDCRLLLHRAEAMNGEGIKQMYHSSSNTYLNINIICNIVGSLYYIVI